MSEYMDAGGGGGDLPDSWFLDCQEQELSERIRSAAEELLALWERETRTGEGFALIQIEGIIRKHLEADHDR